MEPPAFPLIRRSIDVDVFDTTAARTWVCARVSEEIQTRGEPMPRMLLLGDGTSYTLDLDAVTRKDPEASIGATWRSLAGFPDAHRRFLVVRLEAETTDGTAKNVALVVEEGGEPGVPELWIASVLFTLDPQTGLGDQEGEWQGQELPPGEAPDTLMPFLEHDPDGRPVRLLPPRPPAPEIKTAFGSLPVTLKLPDDALGQTELTAAMAMNDLLASGLDGVLVLRFCGHAWEWWVLGGEMPAPLDDMIRLICSRDPAADAVTLALFTRAELGTDRGPGIQLISERAGTRAERWILFDSPEGPAAPKVARKILARKLAAPPAGEGWLGIVPDVTFQLTALDPVGEA